jgi:hypothetical protein
VSSDMAHAVFHNFRFGPPILGRPREECALLTIVPD